MALIHEGTDGPSMRALALLVIGSFISFGAFHISPAHAAAEEDKEGASGPKPYDEVITEDAVSQGGLFTVHRIGDTFYYEVPSSEIDDEYLWVGRVSRSLPGLPSAGERFDSRIVRWEHVGHRVNLKTVSFAAVPDDMSPLARAVDAGNNDIIIKSLKVEAYGEDGSLVIDVTPLFASDVVELGVKTQLRAAAMDADRSYVARIQSFPGNIEVRSVHTYTRPVEDPAKTKEGDKEGMSPGSATLELAYSMVRLPEEPMKPRLFDERVGYFTTEQLDFSSDKHRVEERRYIRRWRLEKQDPTAEISDPIKPIEYYIDPATPAKWIPFIKQGVKDWQSAFEAAGFSKAIIALDAPSPEDDPNWSPEDARYSVIRWIASDIPNARGPSVYDPRTGEILESDIQLYHNVQKLLSDWYFVQVSALDPRARRFPFPDELMGELIRHVVAHEVGHTLGFPHNMKASSTYPVAKLRDPDWISEMGHTPSIMDYSRFNYVAQPEDGIAVADLIPGIGPYDIWATQWGYRPIDSAGTPDDELPTLDRWAREQDETPWYRFSTAGSNGSDAGELAEAVGDADAVAATGLGLRNLDRAMDLLVEATETEGRNWDALENLYEQVFAQWIREMNHVVAIVGGFETRQLHGGQDGVRFEPLPAERQREAVRFLLDNALVEPTLLVRPGVLRLIEPSGIFDRVMEAQRAILDPLLSVERFTRLAEQAALGAPGYRSTEFVEDLQDGIWSGLEDTPVRISAYRRNTQRLYLELVSNRMNGDSDATWNDMRALLRGSLRKLDTSISRAVKEATDTATRYHLEDAREQIAQVLEPTLRVVDQGPSTPAKAWRRFSQGHRYGCWSAPLHTARSARMIDLHEAR